MDNCSACGGTRVYGCIVHTPDCASYTPPVTCGLCGKERVNGIIAHPPSCGAYSANAIRQFFNDHPGLLEIEMDTLRLYPPDVWPDARA